MDHVVFQTERAVDRSNRMPTIQHRSHSSNKKRRTEDILEKQDRYFFYLTGTSYGINNTVSVP